LRSYPSGGNNTWGSGRSYPPNGPLWSNPANQQLSILIPPIHLSADLSEDGAFMRCPHVHRAIAPKMIHKRLGKGKIRKGIFEVDPLRWISSAPGAVMVW
jgi:hypothetical protein